MMLVDTSVWVDHFRGIDSPEAGRLAAAIEDEEDLCICGVVLAEVLQGIAPERQYEQVRRAMLDLVYLPIDRSGFLLAADLYRAARARGRTIRSSVDCVIAACAVAHDVPLLQRDKDFLAIAEVSRLRLVRV